MKKKRFLLLLIPFFAMMILGILVYFQFCRESKVITSIKNGDSSSCNYILNVNANKLYLSDQEAEEILIATCKVYAADRCDRITAYLFTNQYDFRHDKLYCMAKYEKDNTGAFNLTLLPAPW